MDIKTIPSRWVSAWSSSDTDRWVALYTPNGTYIDHAFQIRRSGHKVLRQHHKIWHSANPNFIMTLAPNSPIFWSADTDVEAENGVCSFRTINKGTNRNDMPSYRAAGRTFEFRGVVDIVIEGGLIKELNEWYTHTPFDRTKAVEDYHSLTDEDLDGKASL